MDVEGVEANTCYRSGSAWYVDLVCDRDGNWLPRRNWGPLVFFVLIFLLCMFLTAVDGNMTLYERAGEMLWSLLFFIVFGAIITMLILKNHTGWAWFVALLPFIIFFLSIIVGIFIFMFGGYCIHCTGKCSRE